MSQGRLAERSLVGTLVPSDAAALLLIGFMISPSLSVSLPLSLAFGYALATRSQPDEISRCVDSLGIGEWVHQDLGMER